MPQAAEQILSSIENEVAATKVLPPPAYRPTPVQASASVTQLFSKALIARTIVGCAILIGLNTAVYGFIAWIPFRNNPKRPRRLGAATHAPEAGHCEPL